MSLTLLLQKCPACLVRLICVVLEMGGKCPYIFCFVWRCFGDLFHIAHSILVQFPSSFFSIRLVSVHMMHPYIRSDTNGTWRKFRFYMIDNLLIAVHAFTSRILMSLSVDEKLFPRCVNFSTNFIYNGHVSFLIKTHVLRFVGIYLETNATCCLLQTVLQKFRLRRRIF